MSQVTTPSDITSPKGHLRVEVSAENGKCEIAVRYDSSEPPCFADQHRTDVIVCHRPSRLVSHEFEG